MPLSRRSFFANLAGAPALPVLAAKKKAASRPNVVLIAVDNLGSWMLGIYGNKEMHTPNLDLLARAGMRFTYAYAAAPSAGACLASLLTGRTPKQLADGTGSLASEVMLSDMLAAQGYRCAYAGRWVGGGETRPGHGYSFSSADPAVASEFVRQQTPSKPFFLTLAYPLFGQSMPAPAAKYQAMYSTAAFATISRPGAAANATNKAPMKDTVASIRHAAAALTAFDGQVGALIRLVRAAPFSDNTLIIATGNSGFLMGQRGLWGDGRASDPINMFDETTRVPMIWNWPGKIPVETARPEVVDTFDLVPSICELTGCQIPARNLCGRSFLPIVLNQPMPRKHPWMNIAFGSLGEVELARDTRYKLVLRKGGEAPSEFYDMKSDPAEARNQYDNAQFVTVRNELYTEVVNWRKQYSA